MSELLVSAIVVLVVMGVGIAIRTRRDGADPSGSVQAFNRALSAMEPSGGAQGRGAGARGEAPSDAPTSQEAPEAGEQADRSG